VLAVTEDHGDAVNWYRDNDRIRVEATADEVVETMVADWAAEGGAGGLFAWQRRHVVSLNDQGTRVIAESGASTSPARSKSQADAGMHPGTGW